MMKAAGAYTGQSGYLPWYQLIAPSKTWHMVLGGNRSGKDRSENPPMCTYPFTSGQMEYGKYKQLSHRSVLQKELLKSVWRLSDEKVHLQDGS